MCNQKDCGVGDYCCATSCDAFDGERQCTVKPQVYNLGSGWLTFLTRDEIGGLLDEWKDLVTGSMTWELWYSRRPQLNDTNTHQGNTIMTTYADNHNTNAFSTHNRRRNVGIYIQPDTGQLSITSFVGDKSMLPSAEPHATAGPVIADDNWHHIAAIWNKTEGKAWLALDGEIYPVPVLYEPGSDDPGLDGKLVIGGGHLGRTTTCEVSQFRVWKVALQASHLRSIMACGEPDLPTAELKGFYRLSGDTRNSAAHSGFLPMVWEKSQGSYVHGNPCEIGPAGIAGKSAARGAPGEMGAAGFPGELGLASTIRGPPGHTGRRGHKGPPGNVSAAVQPKKKRSFWAQAASRYEFYACGVICSLATWLYAYGVSKKTAEVQESPKDENSWDDEGDWGEYGDGSY